MRTSPYTLDVLYDINLRVRQAAYDNKPLKYGLSALTAAYLAYGTYHHKWEGCRLMFVPLARVTAFNLKNSKIPFPISFLNAVIIAYIDASIYNRKFHCFTGTNENFGVLSSLPFPTAINRFAAYYFSTLATGLCYDLFKYANDNLVQQKSTKFEPRTLRFYILPAGLVALKSVFLNDGIVSNSLNMIVWVAFFNKSTNAEYINCLATPLAVALQALALSKVSELTKDTKFVIPATIVTILAIEVLNLSITNLIENLTTKPNRIN